MNCIISLFSLLELEQLLLSPPWPFGVVEIAELLQKIIEKPQNSLVWVSSSFFLPPISFHRIFYLFLLLFLYFFEEKEIEILIESNNNIIK